MDRRVARTRGLLHQTMMSLLLTESYETLTVADICEAANIGRSTFYLHYTGKDDLMRAGLNHLRMMLADRQREALTSGDAAPFSFSLPLFEHARDQRILHPLLVGGGVVALGIIREIASDLVRNELPSAADLISGKSMPRELVVQYVVGALMSVLTWWLGQKPELPAEEVNAIFRQLTSEGILPATSAVNRASPQLTSR
jgi:AcrR family transcriptional regulator